jgi:hypothetical protein
LAEAAAATPLCREDLGLAAGALQLTGWHCASKADVCIMHDDQEMSHCLGTRLLLLCCAEQFEQLSCNRCRMTQRLCMQSQEWNINQMLIALPGSSINDAICHELLLLTVLAIFMFLKKRPS